MVLFVTCSEQRMNNMMALLEKFITEQRSHPSMAKRFCFKHVPSFTAHKQTFEVSGHMLSMPWKRAGGFADYAMA
jgi:hypothetical protein